MDPQALMFEHRARVRPAAYYDALINFMPPKITRLLDVGCGPGTLTFPLAERADFAVGIDLSPALIAQAQERQQEKGVANIAWVVANAEVLPFPAETFDAIVSVNVVRLTDIEKTFAGMRRVLKKGGRVAVKDHLQTPQPFGFWGMYIPRLIRYSPSWLRHYGVRGWWTIFAYRLSSEGIAQSQQSESLTAAAFQKFCESVFPRSEVSGKEAGVVRWAKG